MNYKVLDSARLELKEVALFYNQERPGLGRAKNTSKKPLKTLFLTPLFASFFPLAVCHHTFHSQPKGHRNDFMGIKSSRADVKSGINPSRIHKYKALASVLRGLW